MPEEGVDLGPQRIRVFISGNSGNKEVRQKWHDNTMWSTVRLILLKNSSLLKPKTEFSCN